MEIPGGQFNTALEGQYIFGDHGSRLYLHRKYTSSGWIPNGGNVTFKAGQGITLEAGFRVDAGGNFSAIIIDCEEEAALIAAANPMASERMAVQGPLTPPAFKREETPYRKDLQVEVWPNPFQETLQLEIVAPIPELKWTTLKY